MACRATRFFLGGARFCLLCLAFGFGILPSLAQAVPTDDLATKLGTRVAEYRLANLNFVEALIRIGSDFKLPMGIVWVNTPTARSKADFAWRNVAVRDILETVTEGQPEYAVVVTNGIVHISTKAILPEQNFLLLRLVSFHAQGVTNWVKSSLWRQLNTQIDGPQSAYAGSILTSRDDPKLNLDFTDATVIEIFDSIALASDRKLWVVTFEDATAITPSGFRRSRQLSSRNPITNASQPEWDVLYWGYPPEMNLDP
jgi:hypothetical protein